MGNLEKRLLKTKRELSEMQEEKSRLQGRLDLHYETLKSLDMDGVRGAKKKVKALLKQIKYKKEQIELLFKRVEEIKNAGRDEVDGGTD